MDGHDVCDILEVILQVFPLDTYVEKPVNLIQVMPGDTVETPIWDEYAAIIATGESALYANVMLQKGVVV